MAIHNYDRGYDAFVAAKKKELEREYMVLYGLCWQADEQQKALNALHAELVHKKQVLEAFESAPLIIMELIIKGGEEETYYDSVRTTESLGRAMKLKAHQKARETEYAVEGLSLDIQKGDENIAMLREEMQEARAMIEVLERFVEES
jgi:hypothetical protein